MLPSREYATIRLRDEQEPPRALALTIINRSCNILSFIKLLQQLSRVFLLEQRGSMRLSLLHSDARVCNNSNTLGLTHRLTLVSSASPSKQMLISFVSILCRLDEVVI